MLGVPYSRTVGIAVGLASDIKGECACRIITCTRRASCVCEIITESVAAFSVSPAAGHTGHLLFSDVTCSHSDAASPQ